MSITNPFSTDAFRVLFRISGLGAIFYGAYIWFFDSIGANGNAFGFYSGVPAYYFGLPLILGGGTQFIGCWMLSKISSIVGAGFCLSIFLTAEISCIKSQPTSTGVPAYIILCSFYAFSIYCKLCLPDSCLKS